MPLKISIAGLPEITTEIASFILSPLTKIIVFSTILNMLKFNFHILSAMACSKHWQ